MVKMLTFMTFLLTHGHMGETTPETFNLQSPAFADGGMIPSMYTCKGKNISIPLHWRGVPKQSKSLALVITDKDPKAGLWYHWLVYNISPQQTRFTMDAQQLPYGVKAIKNSWSKLHYQGPCPEGGLQQYDMRLYALDKKLELSTHASAEQLQHAMRNHVIGVTRLSGKFASH